MTDDWLVVVEFVSISMLATAEIRGALKPQIIAFASLLQTLSVWNPPASACISARLISYSKVRLKSIWSTSETGIAISYFRLVLYAVANNLYFFRCIYLWLPLLATALATLALRTVSASCCCLIASACLAASIWSHLVFVQIALKQVSYQAEWP